MGSIVDRTRFKEKFQANYIVFIEHQIECCKEEGLHALKDIDILDT